jgi:maleylpyruvate isomerase
MHILYGAVRSSAAWRVRIALELKGVAYREIFHDLHKGEQNADEYRKLNPQQLVPSLQTPTGAVLHQSLAIIEYLEEKFPAPALLPADAEERARVRSLAMIVACDVHPINNLRVRNHIRDAFPEDPEAMAKWMAKWTKAGLDALEEKLRSSPLTGRFCHGDAPGYADCFVVPQVGNARSMGRGVKDWPTIERIADACLELPAFQRADPANIGKR